MSTTRMVVSSFSLSCSLWMAFSTRDAATTGVVFRMSFAMRACGEGEGGLVGSQFGPSITLALCQGQKACPRVLAAAEQVPQQLSACVPDVADVVP